jgi:hypothetical protein
LRVGLRRFYGEWFVVESGDWYYSTQISGCHEFDRGYTPGGINQHVKMPAMKGSARPPGSLGLLEKVAIALGKQEIATGSIRPSGNIWHDFLKKVRGRGCWHLLACSSKDAARGR